MFCSASNQLRMKEAITSTAWFVLNDHVVCKLALLQRNDGRAYLVWGWNHSLPLMPGSASHRSLPHQVRLYCTSVKTGAFDCVMGPWVIEACFLPIKCDEKKLFQVSPTIWLSSLIYSKGRLRGSPERDVCHF